MKRLLPSLTAVDEYNIHNLSFEVNFDLLLCSVGLKQVEKFSSCKAKEDLLVNQVERFLLWESPFFIETRMMHQTQSTPNCSIYDERFIMRVLDYNLHIEDLYLFFIFYFV